VLTKENFYLGKLSLNSKDEVQQDGSGGGGEALATKPNDLSSTPGIHMVEGTDLHMHTMATYPLPPNKCNLKHLGQ
jgi:hypothetical protein